ncbi:hypothetical protein TNIN_368271 [Trichonephila inaurata madagascariensis]|uniref:Uncharacterized protein n=1 Tax=Trichonephila inaurata madagascariensis TaxID=2747483 RepID=A0A8X6JVS6_9ARAC|nr:hypothetical protein TNIN_368271 [Trichonephila inaurata madagascariensis]
MEITTLGRSDQKRYKSQSRCNSSSYVSDAECAAVLHSVSTRLGEQPPDSTIIMTVEENRHSSEAWSPLTVIITAHRRVYISPSSELRFDFCTRPQYDFGESSWK